MFLHIMVGQNPNNKIPKKLHFLILYDVMLEYICAKKNYITTFLKIQIYSKND